MEQERIEALNKIMKDKISLIGTYVRSNMTSHALIELNALEQYIDVQSERQIKILDIMKFTQKGES